MKSISESVEVVPVFSRLAKPLRHLALAAGVATAALQAAVAYGDDFSKTVSGNSGVYSFEVTVPSGGVTYRGFSSSADWLSFAAWQLHGNEMKLAFHVDANTATASRTATLSGEVINHEVMTFTVTQEGGGSPDNGGGGFVIGGGGSVIGGGGSEEPGSLTQTKTIGYGSGSGTFTASSPTGTIDIPEYYIASESWLSTPSFSSTSSSLGGWSLSVNFNAGENPSSTSRTAVLTGIAGGKEVAWFTVVQDGNPSGVTPTQIQTPTQTQTPTQIPTPSGLTFGPGYGSEFRISDSEKGVVVGVYGLNWGNFPTRAYDGCNVFSDSRIVDREKRSGSSAPDHRFCVDYSFLDILFWGGWISGYSDEDEFGDSLIAGSSDVYAVLGNSSSYVEAVSTGSTFANTLVARMAGADRMLAMTVLFDNYTWYGEYCAGSPGIGHGVVCCGYSIDSSKAPTDPTSLKGLFIIESDNDRENSGGGASAPDTITYCPVSWDSSRQRYSISNIFGTTGYIDDNLGGEAMMISAKYAVASPFWSYSDGSDPAVGPAANPAANPAAGTPAPPEWSGSLNPAFAKAQTEVCKLMEADGSFAGVVQVKAGKKSKKGIAKVSATATLLNGKKLTAKAIDVNAGTSGSGSLVFKSPIGKLDFEISADGKFLLSGDAYYADVADRIGGALSASALSFIVDIDDMPDFGSGWQVLDDALPEGVSINVTNNGKKWTLPKSPTLKYKKFSEDGETWYDLIGLDDEKKPNVSGLKLTYMATTGAFKGSFKLYTTNAGSIQEGKMPKLKPYTVNISGFMVDGLGYGLATCKNPAISWSVVVE